MDPILDNAVLRGFQTPRELAIYLRQQAAKVSIEKMTIHLLESVRSEALSPEVFATFLAAVDSPTALVTALRQPFSVFLRHAAIKQFGKVLKTPAWKVVWDEVGGTQGLLTLLSELSVADVDLLCKVIGWSARWPESESTEKQRCVTELLQGVLPNNSPDAPDRRQDERPLLHRYASLVPACTSDFVREMILDGGEPFQWNQWRVRRIAQSHWPMLQQLVLHTLRSKDSEPAPGIAADGLAAESLMECYLPHLLQNVPQLPGHKRGFSASMSFSLEVLRKVAAGAELYYFEDAFESKVVVPLIRRAVAGKVTAQSIREIIDLTLICFERHPDRYSNLRFTEDTFPAYVARVWTTQTEMFESQLIATLRHQSYGKPKALDAFQGILELVKKEHRYHLLRLIILWSDGLKMDIDNDQGLTESPLRGLPTSLFFRLPSNKARELLQRLTRLKRRKNLLKLPEHSRSMIPSILLQPSSPGLQYADPQLLLTLLNTDGSDAKKNAWAMVDMYKEKAFTSREQPDRAFYARSAAFYAIASGSLDLYGQVIIWLRQYLRDPHTAKAIFSSDAVKTQEGIALLSGIPADLSLYGIHRLRETVLKANKVLIDMFETAVLAQAEPSFSKWDWQGIKLLFRHIVEARIIESHRLQKSSDVAQDDVMDVLWAPTIDMLLEIERIGLHPDNEALDFKSPYALLLQDDDINKSPASSSYNPATYRFIDTLANARDQLWQRHRLTLHPECASLNEIWPRGLTIQCLIAAPLDNVTNHAARPYTPFISSHANAVVMIKNNPIVTEDAMSKEERDAVGQFVECYELNLKVDVLQHKPGKDQQRRASAVLAHLLELNRKEVMQFGGKPRMSELEALRFWKPVFERALPGVQISGFVELGRQKSQEYPILPSSSNLRERLEWNPDDTKPSATKRREIPTTLLDCMVTAQPFTEDVTFWNIPPTVGPGSSLYIPKAFTIEVVPPGIWSWEKLRKLQWEPNAVKDGTLVSALLSQASKIRTKSRMLLTAFPTERDVRYPPLFLDQEFLESNQDKANEARKAIFRMMCRAPPYLLQLAVNDALSVIEYMDVKATERYVCEWTAFALVKLLSQCDRPQIAGENILRTIIDRPQSSSWHRYLLTKKFLNRLSKIEAQNFVQDFVASIHEKVNEQASLREAKRRQVTPSTSDSKQDPSSKPLVKVTTIKFLAQFLKDADAISTRDQVSMLCNLIQKSGHVDVTVAVVGSLLSKLQDCDDVSQLEDQILQVLGKLIPRMGSANERQHLDENSGQQFEKEGHLPDVPDDVRFYNAAPILGTLYTAFEDGRSGKLSSHKRTQILNRIIMPAVLTSKENNARWISMYMRTYCVDLLRHASAITLPFKPYILALLLKANVSQMLSWVLADYQKYILINVRPPRWLVSINENILAKAGRVELNEDQHWLSLFNRGLNALNTAGFSLAHVLSKQWQPSTVPNGEGIEIAQVQQAVIDQGSALLRVNDPYFRRWNRFVTCLHPPCLGSDQDKAAWLVNGRPVLEQFVTIIDDLRMAPDWQRDPSSTDYPVLPPTFPLRLQLLNYPQLFTERNASDDHMRRFASQLLTILFEVQDLGLAHHHKMKDIAGAALRVDDQVCLACWLGNIRDDRLMARSERKRTEELMLRVELADRLLEDIRFDGENTTATYKEKKARRAQETEVGRDDEKAQVAGILRSWVRSSIEEIRMRGIRTGRRLGLDVES